MSYPRASADDASAGDAARVGQSGAAVPSRPVFPEIEERVLAYWAADDTFRASVENRPAGQNGSNEFVFYDGPPFANGLPHYGHLLTGYVKDLVPRYQTMRGRHVERRFGWDTHGRPAGWTSTTTTRRSTSTTWKASCGRSNPCGTRVWSTKASGFSGIAGAVRRRCPIQRP